MKYFRKILLEKFFERFLVYVSRRLRSTCIKYDPIAVTWDKVYWKFNFDL